MLILTQTRFIVSRENDGQSVREFQASLGSGLDLRETKFRLGL